MSVDKNFGLESEDKHSNRKRLNETMLMQERMNKKSLKFIVEMKM